MSDKSPQAGTPGGLQPVIRFVAGEPTDEEIAAVVTVWARRRRTAPDAGGASGWAGYWRRAQLPLRPGPGAWRRSLRP